MPDNSYAGEYSFLLPLLAPVLPGWLSALPVDQARVASYDLHDAFYKNDAGGFRLSIRGDEEYPVYVPTAKRIVNTFARYVGRDLSIQVTAQNTALIEPVQLAFDTLFKRERFYTQFSGEKKRGLIRGDWIFGIYGDPAKPEGRRLSIVTVHPGKFFPIPDPSDPTSIIAQQLIEPVSIEGKFYIQIQRWLKPTHPDHPNYNEESPDYEAPIAHDSTTYEQENWTNPAKRKAFPNPASDFPQTLVDGITTLPFYHIRNTPEGFDQLYGISILTGLERIIAAINQTATDEDVAVAMAGLGLYHADSQPVDDDGQPVDWILGPKRVVETPPEGKFERVSGIASIEPSQGHMDWLQKQAESTLGISDVALGEVDTAVAESGIALALRMGPLLDASGEADTEIRDHLVQMFHDLKQWFLVYEGINMGDDITGAIIEPVFGDKLPTDRSGQMDRLAQLYTDGVIPLQFYWAELRKLGVELPDDETLLQLMAEQPSADPEGDRLAAEAAAANDPSLTDANP